jgi:CBS domain-containing protein
MTTANVLTVGDFMTPCPHGIEPHESLDIARERMRLLKVLHLPVRVGGRPVGVLAQRDLELAVAGASHHDLRETQVAEVMTPEPYCVASSTPLADVAGHMADAKIGSALVVDERGELVGIFTVTDGMKALSTVS